MGNKASVLFGGGPQNVLSDSEESSHAQSNGKSTIPVALSAEEQAVADAEAKRYSDLFGGKPKAPKAPSGGRRSARNAAAAAAVAAASTPSKKKKTATPQKKKQRRPDGEGAGGHVDGDRNTSDDGEGEGSAPGSPYRGKAAWIAASPSPAAAAAAEGDKKEKGTPPLIEDRKQQQQRLVQAVSAKILDLEKDKAKEGSLVEQEEEHAVVPATAALTEAARARAAVASALLAGTKPNNNVVAGAVPVGPSAGGVAAMPCRSTSPRPAPPRNFKAKV
eukprot:g4880.t1